jgi:hypothetical protein
MEEKPIGGPKQVACRGRDSFLPPTIGVVLKTLFQNDYGLELTGWMLYAATGISDDGMKITGVYMNPLGQTEAWYVDLTAVPLPPAVYLFGSGLLALMGLGKRKLKIT